jgi:hypothetical protein
MLHFRNACLNDTKRMLLPALYFFLLVIVICPEAHCQELSPPHRPDSSEVIVRSHYYDLFSEHTARQKAFVNGGDYSVEIRYCKPFGTFDISADQTAFGLASESRENGLKFSLQGNVRSLAIAYAHSIRWLHVKAKAEFLKTLDEPLCNYEGAVGLSLQNKDMQNYELSFARRRFPFTFSAAYETENVRFIDPVAFMSVGNILQYEYRAVRIHAGFSRSFPHKTADSHLYTLTNGSRMSEWTAGVTVKSDGFDYQADVQQISFHAEMDLNQPGLSFGYFDIDGIDYLRCEASIMHRCEGGNGLSIAARYYHANGNIVGSLESWPFATVVQSLFLNRVYVRASGDITAQEAAAAFSFRKGNVKIDPRCSFFRVVPELTVETWQPLFLAIGVSNYSKSQPAIKEAGLLFLSVTTTVDALGIEFGIDMHQIVPLYSIGQAAAHASAPAPSVPGQQTASTVGGGRWFRLWIGVPVG